MVAQDVLLNADATMSNTDFNPSVAYSPENIIMHPERIWNYDETRIQMDCTKASGKGKTPMPNKAD